MSHSTDWTREVELLFKNWIKQLSINILEFHKGGIRKRNWHYAFGIFFAITQTGAIITLINVIFQVYTKASDECDISGEQLIFTAAANAIVIIAVAINQLFHFETKSKEYFDTAKDFLALQRLIETTLVTPYDYRDSARETLLSIRQQFDQIMDSAPNIKNIVPSLEMLIYEDPEQARGTKTRTFLLESPPPPEHTTPVELPTLKVNEVQLEDDTEYISHSQRCRFEKKMREQRHEINKSISNLDYQWKRMQEHEDEYNRQISLQHVPNNDDKDNGKDENV